MSSSTAAPPPPPPPPKVLLPGVAPTGRTVAHLPRVIDEVVKGQAWMVPNYAAARAKRSASLAVPAPARCNDNAHFTLQSDRTEHDAMSMAAEHRARRRGLPSDVSAIVEVELALVILLLADPHHAHEEEENHHRLHGDGEGIAWERDVALMVRFSKLLAKSRALCKIDTIVEIDKKAFWKGFTTQRQSQAQDGWKSLCHFRAVSAHRLTSQQQSSFVTDRLVDVAIKEWTHQVEVVPSASEHPSDGEIPIESPNVRITSTCPYPNQLTALGIFPHPAVLLPQSSGESEHVRWLAALCGACLADEFDIALRLLSARPGVDFSDPTCSLTEQFSPMREAVIYCPRMIRPLVKRGAGVEWPGPRLRNETLLMEAVIHNASASVEVLLEIGADPLTTNRKGESALSLGMASNSSTEAVRCLLRHLTKDQFEQLVTSSNRRDTKPIDAALEHSAIHCFKLLLDAAKRYKLEHLVVADAAVLQFALKNAVTNADVPLANLLLEAGASPASSTPTPSSTTSIRTTDDSTPLVLSSFSLLMITAERGDHQMMRVLLEAKGRLPASPTDVDTSTPAATATDTSFAAPPASKTSVVPLLDAREINACSRRGRSALHLAITGHHVECVRLLLEHGADVAEGLREYEENDMDHPAIKAALDAKVATQP